MRKDSLTFLGAIFVFILCTVTNSANAKTLGKLLNYNIKDDGTYFYFEQGIMRVSEITPDVIRVRADFEKEFQKDQSFAVVSEGIKPKGIQLDNPIKSDETFCMSTSSLRVCISKNNGLLRFYDKENNLINQDASPFGVFKENNEIGCRKISPENEHYYGFGEKTGPLDKRGEKLTMWNSDMAYGLKTDPIYQSHPFFIALKEGKSYGIFFDNSHKSYFDMAKSNRDQYQFSAEGGELNYYFIYGPHPLKVIENYTMLTGRFPIPPLWAIGYHQCRYSYKNEKVVRKLANTFREKQIPCDVIYLDIHYMDHYKVFTFHPRRFPDPKGLLSELENKGFKVITIIDPGVKIEPGYFVYDEGLKNNYFAKDKNGGLFKARVWPGDVHFPDFLKPEVRYWWGELHKELLEKGVDGIWNDMNEPAGWMKDIRLGGLMIPFNNVPWLDMVHGDEPDTLPHSKVHNVYALLEAQGTYEGLARLKPDYRPFMISRAGYPGIQKYSSVWTGDNTSSWAQLKLCLPMLMNLSISGIPMVGSDIGGFIGSPTPELYARWIQQGVFYPFCRTHTAIYMPRQEPWSYGKEVEKISKSAIELRYRLLPYIYSLFETAYRSGLPLIRPMFLEFPQDEKTYQIETQFMFGPSILVAPVLDNSAKSKRLYIPEGNWYLFESSETFKGPKEITLPVELESIPMLAKEGAIIPMAPSMNYTGEKQWSPIYVEVYPSSNKSCFSLYEDDGLTFAYQRGEYAKTKFCQNLFDKKLKIEKAQREGSYVTPQRNLIFKIYVKDKPRSVESETSNKNLAPEWAFDDNKKILTIEIKDDKAPFTITINL